MYYCHKFINHFKRVSFIRHEYHCCLGMVQHWHSLCHKTVVFRSAIKQTLCNIIIRCTSHALALELVWILKIKTCPVCSRNQKVIPHLSSPQHGHNAGYSTAAQYFFSDTVF